MTMLARLRAGGSSVASVTLLTFGISSVSGPAWAQAVRPEDDAAAPETSALAQGEYSSESLGQLSSHLATKGTPSRSTDAEAAEASQSLSDLAAVETAAASLPKGGSTISPQAISLPSGPGSVTGMGESFTAQLTTGVASFSIPINLAPARGGAQPTLGLSYSSAGGFGVAGLGWSIGAPAISRQSDRGLPVFSDQEDWHPEQDRFVFNGSELVPICRVSATSCEGAIEGEVMPAWADGWQYFRSRVEGAFLRFFWSPDHLTWRIQSKEGVNLELGRPLDGSGYLGALETNPDRETEIIRWHLVRQYDSHGDVNSAAGPQPVNLVVYRHIKDGNVVYLSDIYDTPPAGDPQTQDLATYAHHAALGYEIRPDVVTSYRAGWLMTHRLRLLRVDVTSKPFANAVSAPREVVRRYHFDYEPGLHTSLLSAVQMEGRCDPPAQESATGELPATDCEALPPMRLEYQRVAGQAAGLVDAQGLSFEPLAEEVSTLASSPPHSLDEELTALMDVNSDGLPDVVVTAPGLYGGGHGLFLAGANSAGEQGLFEAEPMMVDPLNGVDANVLKLSNPNVAPFDLDGDGRLNLVHMPRKKLYEVFSPEGSGTSWHWAGRPAETADQQDLKIDFAQGTRDTVVMDVNADGLVDVVYSSPTEYQTFFALGRYPGGDGQFGQAWWTGPDSAGIINEPVRACTPWSAMPVRFSDPDVRVGDMNGDGLPDIVRLRAGQVLYWPGRGNGTWGTGARDDCAAGSFGEDRHLMMDNSPEFGVADPGSLVLSDVNGDGLSDLVEVRLDAVDVYLNDNATAWTDRHTLFDVPIKPNAGNPVRLADIDGSGTPDLVWGYGYDYRYIDLTGGVRPYVLTRVHNGLGKTTELEYSTSTKLMLAAEAAGIAWESRMPVVAPVVVRSTVRDNLDLVGRAPAEYVTEYAYRDPVYEPRQREFRGFRVAEVRTIGDSNSPSSIERSVFLLGECQALPGIIDSCSPAERWRDNPREALKGLVSVAETLDEAGVYHSTRHSGYELRQLYVGRDGRRVVAALPMLQDAFLYDTAGFDESLSMVSFDEVTLNLDGATAELTVEVPKRAESGTVRIHSEVSYDNFGNPVEARSHGCVEGCSSPDEIITQHTGFDRPAGDGSAWLWRASSSYTTGSVRTARRNETGREYDASGDLTRTTAVLSGTLPLDRFHESGAQIAPAPTNASGGVSSPVTIEIMAQEPDAFGNITHATAPLGRCRTVLFDTEYAQLPVEDTAYGGSIGGDGCGSRAFTVRATYDRGRSLVLTTTGVTGQPAIYDYDGLGRLIAETYADPDAPGVLATYPSATYNYLLPADPAVTPYSIIVGSAQDGASPNVFDYHEAYTYVDGLGRTLVALSEADPAAGDGGQYVVSGVSEYDAKGAPERSYTSWFWSGDPEAFPLGGVPPTDYVRQSYDAFGRTAYQEGLDRQLKARTDYHALSRDLWDAEDLLLGTHYGSTATVRTDGHGRSVEAVGRVHVGGALEQRRMLTEYLPTGEPLRLTQRRAGFPDVIRWMRYDSLGRMVLNVEPNTSTNFTSDVNADPATFKAWRYAYNDAGDLVGTSDARGCGMNRFFDAAGRIVAEDVSPCRTHHPAYTAPDLTTGNGTEAFSRYDTADPETGSIVDRAGTTLPINTSLLWGRLASTSDRGMKGIVRYDARGRITGSAVRVTRPGTAASALDSRYAPRWYVETTSYDGAGRPVASSTGATSAELLGSSGQSVTVNEYTGRGVLGEVSGSYGTLFAGATFDPNGLPLTVTYGDLAGTQRTYAYDDLLRVGSVQTYRSTPGLWTNPPPGYGTPPPEEPSQQLLLEDSDFGYDAVSNITSITDWRTPGEWPASAKPVTRTFSYDDDYRLTETSYQYVDGNSWVSPFDAENTGASDGPLPVPHVSFTTRVTAQTQAYDHLGNTTVTTDDSNAFFDRSLGNITQGQATAGPHQIRSASNRDLAPSSPRKGDLSVGYDAAGNMTGVIVRRDGPCLPAGASCWQRFDYRWDERNQLVRARRWDLSASNPDERSANGALSSPLPARSPNADLRMSYDASGQRVLKTAVGASGNELHTVYVFGGLEIRRTAYTSVDGVSDYAIDGATETVYLPAGNVRARVLYAEDPLPSPDGSSQHVILEIGDHLGSTAVLIDKATSELIEHTSYEAYGQTNADYRPARWGSLREAYKFTGKEEDVQVGLAYFGARYLSLGLGRWMSADPATVHGVRGDANPYAYVAGRTIVAVDPNGELAFLAAVGIAITATVVGALVAGTTSAVSQYAATGTVEWGWKGVGGAMVGGAVGGLVGGGLGAAGAGIGAGAGGGFVGAMAGAAASGAESGDVWVAAGCGALGGLMSSGLEGVWQTSSLTGWDMEAARAGGSTVGGAATGLAIEGIRDMLGYRADYARAATAGAIGGAASWAGGYVARELARPPEQPIPAKFLRRLEPHLGRYGVDLKSIKLQVVDELPNARGGAQATQVGLDAIKILRQALYDPDELATTSLLGHEIVHVIQAHYLGADESTAWINLEAQTLGAKAMYDPKQGQGHLPVNEWLVNQSIADLGAAHFVSGRYSLEGIAQQVQLQLDEAFHYRGP